MVEPQTAVPVIGLLQLNPTVGALEANATRLLEGYRELLGKGAELVVTTECALTGYPPEDLLLLPDFRDAIIQAVTSIASVVTTPLILGTPWPLGTFPGRELNRPLTALAPDRPGWQNCALVLADGTCTYKYAKRVLPNYGVFDEQRWFAPGTTPGLVQLDWHSGPMRLLLTICEDIWKPAARVALPPADILINLSASPYTHGKLNRRLHELRAAQQACGATTALYVNQTGGQDELIFDGRSLCLQADAAPRAASVEAQAVHCRDLPPVPMTRGETSINGLLGNGFEPDLVYDLLVMATRDYIHKSGFNKAVVGLSGGIDSALVLALAVAALGADKVSAIGLPSRFNSADTRSDGARQAALLGVEWNELPIEPLFSSALQSLQPVFAEAPADLTEENLQARLRGVLLMALSNKQNRLLLTTGNKSEYAVGYATLYGDMNGAFAPLKDLYKTEVFALCHWLNRDPDRLVIVPSIIDRPPSAELRDNQRDDQSLPAYEVLDQFLRLWIDERRPLTECTFAGFDAAQAERWARAVRISEYKRRQSPPGPKLTVAAFGRERRLPIVNRFHP